MNINESKKMEKSALAASRLLKVLANPARLMILCRLIEREQSVGELWAKSSLSQSALSQHLSVLRKNKLVKVRKEAQTVYYSLNDTKSIAILETLYKLYC